MIKQTILLLSLFTLLIPFQSLQAIDALSNSERITAHRGSSGSAPENSLSSVLQAARDGAGYAEIDVQLSADGVIVLYHDQLLSKHGIHRNVSDMQYEEILSADIGGWFSPEFTGERVPSLDFIMDAAYKRIKLNIELKMYDPDSPLPEAVVSLIERKGFVGQCIVTSFDINAIQQIKRLNPNIKTGLIISKKKAITDELWSSDIDILSVKSKLVNRKFVKQAGEHHKDLHVWTVNNKNEMKRIMRFNVASIITDYPDQLHKLMKNR